MRILFDGFWWLDGPPSGRMVVKEIIRAWATTFPEDHIVVAVPENRMSSVTDLPPRVQVVVTKLRVHPLINLLELPLISWRMGGVDALYCQNFASPSRKSAVFLHDVLFQSNPEWFTRLERAYFGLMTGIALFAHVVLTSSKSEKSRIISHNPRLKNVIHTGLGMSPAFTDGTAHRSVPGLQSGSFLLSVGRLNARKNLGRTIEAALKSDVLSPDFPLVVVGEASGKTEDLSYAAQAAVTDGRVRFMGFVADDNLLWLYANASLMTFLSLGEGYGLPPVEAMALGTRVLASDLPVMRENLGDYATYVDPTNVDEVANAIKEVCKGDGPAGRPAAIPSWERVVTVSRTALVGGDATSKKGRAAA